MDQEVWKAVAGFEGLYEVSDQGRVRSLDRHIQLGTKKPYFMVGRVLLPGLDKNGYHLYGLSCAGTTKTYKGHRLVALAFVPLVDGKTHVNHKNGVKSDNRADNLEWVDIHENNDHAIAFGFQKVKISIPQILEAKRLYATGKVGVCELARRYGICHQTMSDILCGKRGRRADRELESV